jgi:uncharacterized Fe-S cluster protein YjdI
MDPNDRKYSNEEITVFWYPKKCVHATTCYRELIEVFNPRKKPWVDIHGASTERIIEVVNKCPTKALDWKWNDESKQSKVEKVTEESQKDEVQDKQPVWVQVMKDGPIVVQGKFKAFDGDCKEIKTWSFTSFCRCGNSRNMPFCDGNHRQTGFRSE